MSGFCPTTTEMFCLNSLLTVLLMVCNAQGTHSQRIGRAPDGASWGRYFHARGHFEGESDAVLPYSSNTAETLEASRIGA